MAIRKSKLYRNCRRAMKLEALENRQLLVGIIDDGVETESNFLHEPSGNTLDLVRLTGQIVTVTADEHQITRVSYIDLDGDLVNVDFAGAGEMSISLADEGFIASADFYESSPYSGLNDEFGFVTGKASFFIVGSDATTYFSVFTVGPANDFPDASVTGVGGDGVADITRVIITADPNNSFGSNFNSLFLANTRFTGSTGIVGVSATNVNVKGSVQIGDLNASDSGVPTLLFGAASQFGTVQVSGGSLEQDNGIPINDGGFTSVNFVNSTDSDGDSTLGSVFAGAFRTVEDGGPAIPTKTLIDEDQAFDLTGKTQGEIDDFFLGRNFLGNVLVTGDLLEAYEIDVESFRGDITFTGDIFGSLFKADITVRGNIDGTLTFLGDVDGDVKIFVEGDVGDVVVGTSENSANFDGELKANNIGAGIFTVWGDFGGLLTTDLNSDDDFDEGEGAIGDINVHGDFSGAVVGISGIGNVMVGGNLLVSDVVSFGDGGYVTFATYGEEGAYANIGTITVAGDMRDDGGDELIHIGNNGNFGNITISGGGGGDIIFADIVTSNMLGPGDSTTGTIEITSSGDYIEIGKFKIEKGNLGNITVKGSGSEDSEIFFDDTIRAKIGHVGNITASDAQTITFDGTGNFSIRGYSIGNISATTITGTVDNASSISINHVIQSDAGNIGNIVLNAGADYSEVTIGGNFDTGGGNIGNITITAEDILILHGFIAEGAIGEIMLNGDVLIDDADGFEAADSIGDIEVTGKLKILGTDVGFLANNIGNITLGDLLLDESLYGFVAFDGNIGNIDVDGDVLIGSALGFLAIDGNIGTIDIGGDLVIEDAFGFKAFKGDIDDVTVEGNFEIKAAFGFITLDGDIGNVDIGGYLFARDAIVFGTFDFFDEDAKGGAIGAISIGSADFDISESIFSGIDGGNDREGLGLKLDTGASIDIGGRLESLTVEGYTSLDSDEGTNIKFHDSGKLWFKGDFDSSDGTQPAIAASDGTSALDVIDELVFNGSVRGYDGVPGDDDNPLTGIDIVASRIGDVTFSIDMRLDNFPEGGWNDTNVVRDFGILATPSFEYFGQNPNNQDVLDGLIEQVNLDGTGLSDFSIGNITVETILEVPWTDTSLFNGRNFFISLGGIGAVDLIGDVSGGRQSSLFKSSGDGAWFVVGDVDGLNNESFDLPVPNVGCCGNTDQILVPDYLELDSAVVNIGNVTVNARQTDGTSDVSGIDFINITTYTSAELPGGTLGVNTDTGNSNYSDSGFSAAPTENPDWDGAVVSIGNVTVNAWQTDGTSDVSGIDFIGGDNNNTDFSGLGILSGVRADSADADKGVAIVFFGGAAYTGFVKIGAFNGDDTGMTGNIGDIFITSNRASLFRDDAQFLVDIGTVGPDYMSGIVLSGETGTIQFLPGIAGFGYDANGTQAVILGDDNASTDSEISNYSFDLHDGLNGLNELIVVVVGRNGPEGLVF